MGISSRKIPKGYIGVMGRLNTNNSSRGGLVDPSRRRRTDSFSSVAVPRLTRKSEPFIDFPCQTDTRARGYRRKEIDCRAESGRKIESAAAKRANRRARALFAWPTLVTCRVLNRERPSEERGKTDRGGESCFRHP